MDCLIKGFAISSTFCVKFPVSADFLTLKFSESSTNPVLDFVGFANSEIRSLILYFSALGWTTLCFITVSRNLMHFFLGFAKFSICSGHSAVENRAGAVVGLAWTVDRA